VFVLHKMILFSICFPVSVLFLAGQQLPP
jgi:hypothetical protein